MRPRPNHMIVPDTPELHGALVEAIKKFQPQHVVETGTHKGTGTTRVLLHALQAAACKVQTFNTIEVDPYCYSDACYNLRGTGVTCNQGLSVGLAEAIEVLTTDEFLRNAPENVAIDVEDPQGYWNEIHGNGQPVTENLLKVLLPKPNPLICLDSAGALGWLEFRKVLELQKAYPTLFLLDDVNHVKHYRSMQYIQAHPTAWRVWGHNPTDGWMVAESL